MRISDWSSDVCSSDLIPAWKAAPALAFGNTVVLKPANATPAIAHALAAIIHEAADGLQAPGGIFNLVLGQGGVGAAIADNPGLAGIRSPGSRAAGAEVGMPARVPTALVNLALGGKMLLDSLTDALSHCSPVPYHATEFHDLYA